MEIVVASSNQGKIKEIKELIGNSIAYSDILDSFEIEECGLSFKENAIIKAKAIYKKLNKDSIVLADDSGISVEALDFKPGIYSARYAGVNSSDKDNLEKLIHELKSRNLFSSPAFYTCAIALIYQKELFTMHGFMYGDVIVESKGEGGFGYDPIFIPKGFDKTLGQLPKDIKNKISHRTKALNLAKIILKGKTMITFSELLLKLQQFWNNQGCVILQPYDLPAGAGTFHPATLLRSLDSKPWSVAYVAPSRRPTDGRYGENPNRLGSYYQFQVLIKPSPKDIQSLYLQSLEFLGLNLKEHDIRFVEDNWESPTLGAWGLGWEVWLDGMEVTQFTYFQQVGSLPCEAVEITYGTERLATYLQGVDNVFDIIWTKDITYKDVHLKGEYQFSKYHFEVSDTNRLFQAFELFWNEAKLSLENGLPLPAYDFTILSSHFFNMLDARGAISVAQRQEYILRIRELAKGCAILYKEQGEEDV